DCRSGEWAGKLGSICVPGKRSKGQCCDSSHGALSAVYGSSRNGVSARTSDQPSLDRHRTGRCRWRHVVVRVSASRGTAGANVLRPVTVGIIGAGNVIWAYFQGLDRLIPRGLAQLGPVCARRKETWHDLQTRRPGINLVADPGEVFRSDVDVILIITPPSSHSELTQLALQHGKHV